MWAVSLLLARQPELPTPQAFPSHQDLARGLGFLSTFYPKNREKCIFWGTSCTPMVSDNERHIAGVVLLDDSCKKVAANRCAAPASWDTFFSLTGGEALVLSTCQGA